MRVSTQSKSFRKDWRWHLKNAVRDLNRLASELEVSLTIVSRLPLTCASPLFKTHQKGDRNDLFYSKCSQQSKKTKKLLAIFWILFKSKTNKSSKRTNTKVSPQSACSSRSCMRRQLPLLLQTSLSL